MMKRRKVRSGPVYVETERGIVSLVFEGTMQEGLAAGSRLTGKPDVYVIDGDGVHLVRHKDRIVRAMLAALVAYMALRAISLVYETLSFRSRSRSHSRHR